VFKPFTSFQTTVTLLEKWLPPSEHLLEFLPPGAKLAAVLEESEHVTQRADPTWL